MKQRNKVTKINHIQYRISFIFRFENEKKTFWCNILFVLNIIRTIFTPQNSRLFQMKATCEGFKKFKKVISNELIFDLYAWGACVEIKNKLNWNYFFDISFIIF